MSHIYNCYNMFYFCVLLFEGVFLCVKKNAVLH